jgi:glycosyltransferase involved in cell wall biosynthesis
MKASAGKRVLMLLENNPYQQDTRVKLEARALTEAGYRVSVISPKPSSHLKSDADDDGIRLYQFPAPLSGGGFLGYLWEYGYSTLAMLALSFVVWLQEGFDIIHAHSPPDTMFVIGALYKLLGRRFLYDHHDLSPEAYRARFGEASNRWVYNTLVLFERLTCRLADRVIATNQSHRAMETMRGGVPAERITIVRNGPDLERVGPVAPDHGLRKRASTILGYVGVMGPQDGVDYLLRSIHALVYKLGRNDLLCVVIGKGDAIPQLAAMAGQLAIKDHVWFTGWIPDEDLLRFLSTADICVDPDPSNEFNDRCTMIKMMEYMALGKPIVAFDLPEHRITAQDAAVYAYPNDEFDFARQIALLIDDPARREAMGSLGRRRVETELAWCFSVPKLLQAYHRLSPNHLGTGTRQVTEQ